VATIGRILELAPLSQFDQFGRPLSDVFAGTPDTSVYVARTPRVPMNETNRDSTVAAVLSRRLDLSREDRADPRLFNRILWLALAGTNSGNPRRAPEPRP
jgi:hypothetical protein